MCLRFQAWEYQMFIFWGNLPKPTLMQKVDINIYKAKLSYCPIQCVTVTSYKFTVHIFSCEICEAFAMKRVLSLKEISTQQCERKATFWVEMKFLPSDVWCQNEVPTPATIVLFNRHISLWVMQPQVIRKRWTAGVTVGQKMPRLLTNTQRPWTVFHPSLCFCHIRQDAVSGLNSFSRSDFF